MSNKRRSFTPEYKEQVARMVVEESRCRSSCSPTNTALSHPAEPYHLSNTDRLRRIHAAYAPSTPLQPLKAPGKLRHTSPLTKIECTLIGKVVRLS